MKKLIMHSCESKEWYTPAPIIEDIRSVLGEIDLDPCCSNEAAKTIKPAVWYSEGALEQPWTGRVYVNPPGGKVGTRSLAGLFWQKLIREWIAGHVTQFLWFAFNLQQLSVLQNYHAYAPLNFSMCIARKRIPFIRDGILRKRPPGACAFIYHGANESEFYQTFAKYGQVRL